MREIYEKLTKIEEEAPSEKTFNHEIDLNVHMDEVDEHQAPSKVNISFTIEVDYRSWGIKAIELTAHGTINFETEIFDREGDVIDTVESELSFDTDDVAVSWVSGHAYVPESLEVSIDKFGKVLNAELYLYFLDQSK